MHILVAGRPQGALMLSRAVSGQADVQSADSLQVAVTRANEHPDVIACELNFDDSRMFELVKTLKADEAMRDIPVVCFRVRAGSLPAAIVAQVKVALQALGVVSFVDLVQLSAQLGTDRAFAQLGETICRYL